MSIAHCVFYPKLRGKVVGNSSQQEEKTRFGTAFAILAQICLGASDMLRKMRLGSAIAFFAWSLLLPCFFTPATLFVYSDTDVIYIEAMMPYPPIANTSEAHRFSYSPPIRRG
ncbi:hypothetical protein EK21DRAFT_116192 [Setomelanomma holmii]|uniref:Uncharacterized protein n=1 Tax=Setomelanomma holmii TaxID=210430 RepID=A0A9P4H1Y1_9PLEO|nr:hypothetical protein EK21DRAFT_116192 [Setomelanomma holmii]